MARLNPVSILLTARPLAPIIQRAIGRSSKTRKERELLLSVEEKEELEEIQQLLNQLKKQ